MKISIAIMENGMELPQKLNIKLPYDHKRDEIRISKRYLYFHAHYSIIHNRQDAKITLVPANR